MWMRAASCRQNNMAECKMHVLKIRINNGSFNPTKNTSNKFKEGMPEQQTVLDGMTMRRKLPLDSNKAKLVKQKIADFIVTFLAFF